MPRTKLIAAAVTLVAVLLAMPLWAQKTTGIITGTVTDQSGAVVGGATVTVTEERTGMSRTATTNDQGSFTFPELQPGFYRINVRKEGFKQSVQTGLQLNVASTADARIQMQVGGSQEEVTVEAAGVAVETQTGQASNIILGSQVRELPLNGRNFVQLTTLVPGASVAANFDPKNKGLLAGVDISFSGAPSTNNQWLVDGANNNDVGSQRTILVYPSIDAIDEFKIHRNSYGPEYGSAGGAQVNIVTRGGGNQFHGSAYYFGRNDALNAKGYFLPADAEKNPLRRNDFGYTIGGPVVKDRVFFFWSQEWNYERRGTVRTAVVPTEAERAGNFSATCAGRVPNDPSTGAPFAGNTIPADRISPAGQSYLALLPLPNQSDPCGEFNWIDTLMVPIDWREESARGDIQITKSTNLMLRYAQNAWINGPQTYTEGGLWGEDEYPAVDDSWDQPGKIAIVKLTTTIGQTAVNDFQFSWSANRIKIRRTGNEALNQSVTSAFPLVYPSSSKMSGDERPFPICWCGGLTGTVGVIGPWDNSQDLFTWKDDFSKVAGNHTFKMGVLFDRNKKDERVGTEQGGLWGVTGVNNGWGGGSGNSFADFLIEDMTWGYQESETDTTAKVRWSTFETYLGDTWKVNPRLTLELGVRWSLLNHPYLDDDRLAGFNPAAFNAALGNSPCNGVVLAQGAPNECESLGFAGGTHFSNRSLMENDRNTVAPRLGFAWDVTGAGRFVLRGGVGQFFSRDRLLALHVSANSPPFSVSGAGQRMLDSVTPGVGLFDFVVGGSPAQGLESDPILANSWQWNLTTEIGLWRDAKIETSWVANRGIHLLTTWNANQIRTGDRNNNGVADRLEAARSGDAANDALLHPYGASARGAQGITMHGHRGDSIYHSWQTLFTSKFARNSIAQVAYTWSKNIATTGFGYVDVNTLVPDLEDPRSARGLADFDRPHVLSGNVVYVTPELSTSSGMMRALLGEWQVGGVVSLSTGNALTVTGGVAGFGGVTGTGVAGNFGNRPLRNFSEPCHVESDNPLQWLNPRAFTFVGYQLGTNGNSGPGQCHAPPTKAVDLAFDKNWSLPWRGGRFFGENAKLQFRLEVFNLFNTPNFRNVNTFYGTVEGLSSDASDMLVGTETLQGGASNTFGRARDISLRGNREIQYGLKLVF